MYDAPIFLTPRNIRCSPLVIVYDKASELSREGSSCEEIRGRFCGLRRKLDFSKNPKIVKNYLTLPIDSGIISLALRGELKGA